MVTAGDDDNADFSLSAGESEAGRRPSRWPFEHRVDFYAQVYECSIRTIKGWVAIGRDADPAELPPLDERAAMKAWWRRHKRNRPPEVLVRYAAGASFEPTLAVDFQKSAPGAASAGVKNSITTSTAGDGCEQVAAALPAERGFSAALVRVRQQEAETSSLYLSLVRRAQSADTANETAARLSAEAESVGRRLEVIQKQLRAYESDKIKILEAEGRTWSAVVVVASLEVANIATIEGFRTMRRRLAPALAACRTEAERDELWERAIDRLCERLQEGRFMAVPDFETDELAA